MLKQRVEEQTQDLSDVDMFHQLDEVTKQINEAQDKLRAFEEILHARRTNLERTLTEKADAVRWSRFRPEFLPEDAQDIQLLIA